MQEEEEMIPVLKVDERGAADTADDGDEDLDVPVADRCFASTACDSRPGRRMLQ